MTNFSGNKVAYPVYLTLGNIPRAIRRKPSEHACILLGYLPSVKVAKHGLTHREQKARNQQLFHRAMRTILDPLQLAGRDGMEVTGGDGCVRHVHPVLAAYVADYPEQCLVTCSKYGTCPKCLCPADKLEHSVVSNPRTAASTKQIIQDSYAMAPTAAAADTLCMEQEVSGSTRTPFWEGLPYTDIHLSIMPDVLHQLYQGVFKHMVAWCQDLLGPDELDRRLRCLPPAYGIRHFKNGISALSQITGKERKDMARVLLGCLIGKVPRNALLAFRALLDFIYIAQYPTHDDTTLKYLADALSLFHRHKDILVKLGVRDHLNIPKFHSLLHYVESIRLLGTTDNYNTEMFERLHIDFAKKAWRASNHRDEFPQMARWITRREKMVLYEAFQKECEAEEDIDFGDGHQADADDPLRSGLGIANLTDDGEQGSTDVDISSDSQNTVRIAKYPPAPQQHLASIQSQHNSPGFTTALVQFINDLQPPALRLTRHDLTRTWLPFSRLDVFHKFQFSPVELLEGKRESDVVKAIPGSSQRGRKSRFDTVIVLNNENAESTGVQGKSKYLMFIFF